MAFLTYEEELSISDDLYERRVILDYMIDSGIDSIEELSTKDRETVERGISSANRLVEAYSPFAWSCARSVYDPVKGNGISIEDLYQEAQVAMLESTRAYDARGSARGTPSGRAGRRFSSYCRQHVLKKLNSYQARSGFHLSAGSQRIYRTGRYKAVYDYLSLTLGRPPTDEEVQEYSGLTLSDTTGLTLTTAKPVEIDRMVGEDEDRQFDLEFEGRPVSEIVSESLDSSVDSLLLSTVLYATLAPDLAKVILSSLGVDRGYPREISEVAEDLGVSRKFATMLLDRASTVLRHPQFRIGARKAIEEEAQNIGTEIPGEEL